MAAAQGEHCGHDAATPVVMASVEIGVRVSSAVIFPARGVHSLRSE